MRALDGLAVVAGIAVSAAPLLVAAEPPTVAEQLPPLAEALRGGFEPVPPVEATLVPTLLAKAKPDECYYGIGDERNRYEPDVTLPCPAGGRPKVNQAYVWGLASAGTDLWFGTGANVNCLVAGGLSATAGNEGTVETASYVCEVEKSAFGGRTGDWRPPRVFVYDEAGAALLERTGGLDPAGRALLDDTLGIRAAGAFAGIVFLGGPSRAQDAVHLFAFRASDRAFLGSRKLTEYRNIRKFLVSGSTVYTGVGAKDGGRVLRWRGSEADPLAFEVVGKLDGEGAELALHEGRLFVATWSSLGGDLAAGTPPSPAMLTPTGIWMSPVVPEAGLDASHAGGWTKAWRSDEYEPDPIVALAYGGGAIASWEGWLYWGTLHIPGGAYAAHLMATALVTGKQVDEIRGGEDRQLLDFLGTWRATALFRGRGFGTAERRVELLYGEPSLPAADRASGTWAMAPNRMGAAPLHGHAGFGNGYNAYTWAMGVWQGQLWVGTFDIGYLFAPDDGSGTNPALPVVPNGADLFRFPSPDAAAVAESLDGIGNRASYGIRTLVAADDALFLGMANPMNLMADPQVTGPKGGWELIRLVPKAPPPGPDPTADAAGGPDTAPAPAGGGGGGGCASSTAAGGAAGLALAAAIPLLASRRRRGRAAACVLALSLLAACDAADEGVPIPESIRPAVEQARDLDATFPLRRASGGAAGLRDAMPARFPALADLSRPDPAIRDALVGQLAGTPRFERDLELAIYAYALERMGDEAAIPGLSRFVTENLNADAWWSLHFATHALLALGGGLAAGDTGFYSPAEARAAAASGGARSSALAAVASAADGRPSCAKRYRLVDGDGNPITYVDAGGTTRPVAVGGNEFATASVPASVAANYKAEVTGGGGTYVADDPEFPGEPSKQFNCAGYAFRDFNGGKRWTADPADMHAKLVGSGLLVEVPEGDARPGDKVFYFRKGMALPGHVAEVKTAESGLTGTTVTVRNADGQSGLWDARIDAAYYTGTLLGEATYPARKVYRWASGKAPRAVPDPGSAKDPAVCGVTAPAADGLQAEVDIPGFLVSFRPTQVIASGPHHCMAGIQCRPGIQAVEMNGSEASEVLSLAYVPELVLAGGTYAFGESAEFLDGTVPVWMSFTTEDVTD
ncbi:MAG: hypothetical protein FJ087_16350, partial [Deltaproteobacteria bacterium]|nr:hypothetical protein [Deltaproteobacteria bacterium]